MAKAYCQIVEHIYTCHVATDTFFSEYNQKMYRNHKSMPKPVPPVGADSYPDSYVSGNNTGGRFGVLVSLVISQ